MCSLNVSLVSSIIPKYFKLHTCVRGRKFKYMCVCVCVCVCLTLCDLETSQRGGLDMIWAIAPQKRISIYV